MCLDSDIFDLWRSCGDCNISRTEPECQLSCEYCLAGEGIDTAEHPAPRADQILSIPAEGCSVDRRDFELECRPQSAGSCGETCLTSPSLTLLYPDVTAACLLHHHHHTFAFANSISAAFVGSLLAQFACQLADASGS